MRIYYKPFVAHRPSSSIRFKLIECKTEEKTDALSVSNPAVVICQIAQGREDKTVDWEDGIVFQLGVIDIAKIIGALKGGIKAKGEEYLKLDHKFEKPDGTSTMATLKLTGAGEYKGEEGVFFTLYRDGQIRSSVMNETEIRILFGAFESLWLELIGWKV